MVEMEEAEVVDVVGVDLLVVGASWTEAGGAEALVEAEAVDPDNGEEAKDRWVIMVVGSMKTT
jgi:hypothetical protein